MIPSFKHGIIASSMPKAAADGGSDVTPNAVNWQDGFSIFPDNAYSSTETISGINTSINIYYTINFVGGPPSQVVYSKNGGTDTALNENINLSVSNNDTIRWGLDASAILAEIEIEVKNASDGNAVLDTIYLLIEPQ